MKRKPFKPTPLTAALQAASLLALAGSVFAILITDITRHGSEGTKVEAPSEVQLLAATRGEWAEQMTDTTHVP
jgi:hypothetical protein